MKKQFGKRAISALLCLCMLVGLLPTAALAAGTQEDPHAAKITRIIDSTSQTDIYAVSDHITININVPFSGPLSNNTLILYPTSGSGESYNVKSYNVTLGVANDDGSYDVSMAYPNGLKAISASDYIPAGTYNIRFEHNEEVYLCDRTITLNEANDQNENNVSPAQSVVVKKNGTQVTTFVTTFDNTDSIVIEAKFDGTFTNASVDSVYFSGTSESQVRINGSTFDSSTNSATITINDGLKTFTEGTYIQPDPYRIEIWIKDNGVVKRFVSKGYFTVDGEPPAPPTPQENLVDVTASVSGQTVTQFANTDTVTFTVTLPTGVGSTAQIASPSFMNQQSKLSLYIANNAVTVSGDTATITFTVLREGYYNESYDLLPGDLITPGTYQLSFWNDGEGYGKQYKSSASFTVTAGAGTAELTAGAPAVTMGSYAPLSLLPITWQFNASLPSDAQATVTLNYTNASNEPKSQQFSIRPNGSVFSGRLLLPEGIKTVTDVSLSANINGQDYAGTVADVSGVTILGALKLSVSNPQNLPSGSVYIIKSGDTEKGRYSISATSVTAALENGTYTVYAAANVNGQEVRLCNDVSVTISAGTVTEQALHLTNPVKTYTANVTATGSEAKTYVVHWYDGSGENATLLAKGNTYQTTAEGTLYAQAFPTGALAVTHSKSGKVAVTPDSAGTLTIPQKPTFDVAVTMQCGTADNSPVNGYGYLYVKKPGENGRLQDAGMYYANRSPYTIPDVTEGSVITFSPWGSFGCDTVTSDSLTSGSTEITLTAPLAKGTISFPSRYNGQPIRLSDYVFTVTKYGSSEEIPFHKGPDMTLVLEGDLSGVTDVTITGRSWSYSGDPDYPQHVLTASATLSGDKSLATATITRITTNYEAAFRGKNPLQVPYRAMLYGDDGLIADYTAGGGTVYVITPYLPSGSYTMYFVPEYVLRTLDKDAYTASADAVSQYAEVTETFTIDGSSRYIEIKDLPLPEDIPSVINYDLSTVKVHSQMPNTYTIDSMIVLSSDHDVDLEKEIVIVIDGGKIEDEGNNIEAYASVNGVPYGSGIGITSGAWMLRLSPEYLRRCGGFPLRISTIVQRTMSGWTDCDVALNYYPTGSNSMSRVVAAHTSLSEELSFFAPDTVASKHFGVYGFAPRSEGEVTIYLDGVPVTTVTPDTGSGRQYVGTIDLPCEYGSIASQFFTLSASYKYTDGDKTVVVHSPTREVHYAPNNASLKAIVQIVNGTGYTLWQNGRLATTEAVRAWDNSGLRLQWEVEFNNPNKVESAWVHVPQGDGSEILLEAKKKNGDKFVTDPITVPFELPTGVYVTFDAPDPVYLTMSEQQNTSLSDQDVTDTATLLNNYSDGIITNMTGTAAEYSFTLKNSTGGTIPVTVSMEEGQWDPAEVKDFERLTPLFPDTLPHIIEEHSGYRKCYGDDDELYWCVETLSRYPLERTISGGAVIYQREFRTAGERIMVTWDTSTQKKTIHRITLGSGAYNPAPDIPVINDPDIAAGNANALRAYGEHIGVCNDFAVNEIWEAVFSRIAEAYETALAKEANAGGGNNGSRALRAAAVKRGPAAPVGSRAKFDFTKVDYQKYYKDAKEVADSYTWARGEALTPSEARALKDFYDDNAEAFYMAEKMYGSAGDDTYRIFKEINYVCGEVCLSLLGQMIGTVTGLWSGGTKEFVKNGLQAIKDGAEDYAKGKLRGYAFGRQSQNMAYEAYWKARMLERNESGIGGALDGSKLNWDRFPWHLMNDASINDDPSTFGGGGGGGGMVNTAKAGWRRETLPKNTRQRIVYDPSGFVYEAVPSNRLEGVNVDLYTLSGGVMEFANADHYGIEPNPQTTDASGRYEWFVPQGYWRVIASKAGYTTVDTGSSSEFGTNATNVIGNKNVGAYWMPVLPVQLDVNIPLVSYAPPTVSAVEATADGVYVTFSKYMQRDLGTSNFFINGAEAASVTPQNAELDPFTNKTYASIFLVGYPGSTVPNNVDLQIDGSVQSYAGVAMGVAYSEEGQQVEQLEGVKAPTASPTGEVEKNTMVTLTSNTPGATIYYTLDGTVPTAESTQYKSPIVVDKSLAIKAIAVKPGMADSTVASFSYTVKSTDDPTPPTPPAPPFGGGGSSGAGGSSTSAPSSAARQLADAKPGDTVKIDMKGKTSLSASDLKNVAGKDVDIVLDMGGGVSWEFNGKDVPSGGLNLNLGIKTNADTIPATILNALTGDKHSIQMELSHNGKFGMTLNLSLELGEEYNGFFANLYYLNPNTSKLEFQSAGKIADGKASWPFDHASGYAIVIDEADHGAPVFTDVADGTYYAEAVKWAVGKGVTSGTGNGKFSPDADCTRAQIVTFLWRAAGSPEPKSAAGFSDVDANSYYAKAVAWAVENGITSGTGNGRFSPDETCTRAQAVTFLSRALKGTPSGTASFTDVAADAYYASAVAWAAENGITSGTSTTTFSPNASCTRAQIVTFLWRAMAE